jgi:hypothetical protein
MDLADKLGALSLKNASIQEKGASPKTKTQRPEEEFRIPKNFKYPFGLQVIKFERLVEDLLSLRFQEASLSLSKRLNKVVGSLNAILTTSAKFERRQLDSPRQSIFLLDCYFLGISSKEGISLKKKITPQTNKMLESIKSRIEIQVSRNEIKKDKTNKLRKSQKELNRKKFSKRRQKERARKKETGFSETDKNTNCHFLEGSNFSPPSSFSSI